MKVRKEEGEGSGARETVKEGNTGKIEGGMWRRERNENW